MRAQQGRNAAPRGRTLRTRMHSLAFGGDGVGKLDGKVCFVKGALPGEEIVFDVIKETDSYIKGKVKEIIEASPDRVEPVCKYYGKCGGCQLQHISYEKELFYKREQIAELVKRIAGKRDVACLDIVPSPEPYHYRSGVTLHRKQEGWGYFTEDGINVMLIDECPIAEKAINDAIPGLTAPEAKDSVTIKADAEGKVWISDVPGARFFTDSYDGTKLFASPKAFAQANRHIALAIARELEAWIGPVESDSAFFDVYCGIGFYTFLVRQEFGIRVGMDESRIAIDCAKSTERESGRTDLKFYLGNSETEFTGLFKRLKKKTNILFLDPPRKGAEKFFLEELKGRADIDRIYYLSCDPARLARDIKIMTDSSAWELGRLRPFDMFPRTKHIETLAEFIRK